MPTSSEKTPLLGRSSNAEAVNCTVDNNGDNQRLQNEAHKSNLVSLQSINIPGSDAENTSITNITVIALAFTVFVQSYLLEGVFPYAGFLTMHLLSSEKDESGSVIVNEENVGKYAGYIACSFMAGRTITAVFWGRLADAYGRVFVLEVSLVASAITSLGFGFASTYAEALVWRFLMGVGNGITGTIKCLLSEIKESSVSEAKETKTMAIVYGMRGYGFLLCPAITGFLSDPIKQYPKIMISTKIPLCVQSLLLAYPFVLPNLLAFFLCWAAFRLVRDHVEETLPEERRRPFSLHPVFKTGWRKKFMRTKEIKDDNSNEIVSKKSQAKDFALPVGTNDTTETSESDQDTPQSTRPTSSTTTADFLCYSGSNNSCDTNSRRLQQRRIRGRWLHLYVYWIFSFLNIASDELFPLFCLSKQSGLGLLENQISSILGGTTIVYGFLQYFLLTGLVQKLGLYKTLRIGIFGSVPPSILIPIGSLWLVTMTDDSSSGVGVDDSMDNAGFKNSNKVSNKVTPLMALYLCIMIAAIKSFASVAFSTVTMATNRTVDTIDQRATLNGIASLGGSFAKACGPVFAGTLFSFLAGNAIHNGTSHIDASPTSSETSSPQDRGFFHSYSITKIEPPYGSIVAYGILSALGFILGVQSLFLQGINDANASFWQSS